MCTTLAAFWSMCDDARDVRFGVRGAHAEAWKAIDGNTSFIYERNDHFKA